MSKKSFPTVTSQDESWDDEVNDIVEILENQPFPITDYATIAALPAANINEEGLAWAQANNDVDYTGDVIVASTGSSWKKLAWQATEVTEIGSAPSITDPADTPADADALRDDLVTNTIPSIESALSTIYTKIDSILAAMKNTGAMASA